MSCYPSAAVPHSPAGRPSPAVDPGTMLTAIGFGVLWDHGPPARFLHEVSAAVAVCDGPISDPRTAGLLDSLVFCSAAPGCSTSCYHPRQTSVPLQAPLMLLNYDTCRSYMPTEEWGNNSMLCAGEWACNIFIPDATMSAARVHAPISLSILSMHRFEICRAAQPAQGHVHRRLWRPLAAQGWQRPAMAGHHRWHHLFRIQMRWSEAWDVHQRCTDGTMDSKDRSGEQCTHGPSLGAQMQGDWVC